MSKRRVVIDTTALISYFAPLFGENPKISQDGIRLIKQAFQDEDSILLVIPSIVFIEIFEKWVHNEEFQAKFRAEVLEPVRQSPNIEIRPIDKEVLEFFMSLEDPDINLENHDKIVLASAMTLNAPLITSDRKIKRFVRSHENVPEVIS